MYLQWNKIETPASYGIFSSISSLSPKLPTSINHKYQRRPNDNVATQNLRAKNQNADHSLFVWHATFYSEILATQFVFLVRMKVCSSQPCPEKACSYKLEAHFHSKVCHFWLCLLIGQAKCW